MRTLPWPQLHHPALHTAACVQVGWVEMRRMYHMQLCPATFGVQRVLQVAGEAAQAVRHRRAPLLRCSHHLRKRKLRRVGGAAAAAPGALVALSGASCCHTHQPVTLIDA